MKNNTLRILFISGGVLDRGGISLYMMNFFRRINGESIRIDFLVQGDRGVWDEEIESQGGRVYHVPTKRKSLIGNYKGIKQVIKNGKYDIVHSHTDGMNGYILKIAYDCKVKTRISHSHNTAHIVSNPVSEWLHDYIRKQIPRYATDMIACSRAAGDWLYDKKEYQVIPNAIDAERFTYSKDSRARIREDLCIGDSIVIGNIGHLTARKNQPFLIELIREISEQSIDATLLLVGDGEEREKLKELAEKYGVQNKVLLVGEKDNTEDYLSAMDVFVLPSLFEGFPVTMIEAQANGLPCVVSDKVTKEVKIADNVRFADLNSDKAEWIETILSCNRIGRYDNIIKGTMYDINVAARSMEDYYRKCLR